MLMQTFWYSGQLVIHDAFVKIFGRFRVNLMGPTLAVSSWQISIVFVAFVAIVSDGFCV